MDSQVLINKRLFHLIITIIYYQPKPSQCDLETNTGKESSSLRKWPLKGMHDLHQDVTINLVLQSVQAYLLNN